MPDYEIHMAAELPFWLALPEQDYVVTTSGSKVRLRLSNSVDRLDVGDFYLGQGVKSIVWTRRESAEEGRSNLQSMFPSLPVTRHQTKTMLTNVIPISAGADAEVERKYGESGHLWFAEMSEALNTLVDAYSLQVRGNEKESQVGRVASWDLGMVVVSGWKLPAMSQIFSRIEYAREENPPPDPLSGAPLEELLENIASPGKMSVAQLLHVTAASRVARGSFREAIVDDVTAMELEVETKFRELAATKLPEKVMDYLLKLNRFEDMCGWIADLGGSNLKTSPIWKSLVRARTLRHQIVHRGATATVFQANEVRSTCDQITQLLGSPS